MRPRIILRTHYQANEPRAIVAAAIDCASPTESRQEDAVAAALVKWAEENGQTLSLPGAVYAVGNAKSLGLLNTSQRWTATGLAFGYVQSVLAVPKGVEGLPLTRPERRLYLKCYLEHGGALVVKFGQWLLNHGHATDDQLRDESIIEHLLVQALDEYLAIATDVRDRAAIRRERERLARLEYKSLTKRHKRYPLLRTMERLQLIVCVDDNRHQRVISPDPAGRLAATLKVIPDIPTLERLCRDDALSTALTEALGGFSNNGAPQGRPVASHIVDSYRFAIQRGLQACPLQYLDDVLFAFHMASGGLVTAEPILERLRRRYPHEVRFHVNRRGRRAFVLIGSGLELDLERLLDHPAA
jgi:hypothetical protein